MGLGGLTARAALLREQLKRSPCERCGFMFELAKEEKCPQCSELSNAKVAKIVNARERQYETNKSLGVWFYWLALVSLIIFVATYLLNW